MTQGDGRNAKPQGKKTAAAGAKDAKPGKKGGGLAGSLLLILIILILTSIIALGAIFLFNFGGLKQQVAKMLVNIPVVGKLIQPVVEDKTPEQLAQEKLDLQRNELTTKEKQLQEKENELKAKEKTLTAREEALKLEEQEIAETRTQLSEKLTSIQEQVQYLEKIENNKAVQILMSMEEQATVIQILRNMKKEKASAILALMDPLQAAQLLEELAAGEAVPGNNSETSGSN